MTWAVKDSSSPTSACPSILPTHCLQQSTLLGAGGHLERGCLWGVVAGSAVFRGAAAGTAGIAGACAGHHTGGGKC